MRPCVLIQRHLLEEFRDVQRQYVFFFLFYIALHVVKLTLLILFQELHGLFDSLQGVLILEVCV